MADIELPEQVKESCFKDADVANSATLKLRLKGLYSRVLATLCNIVSYKRFIATLGLLVMAGSGFLISEGKFLYPQTLFEFLDTHPKLAPAAFIAVYVVMTLLLTLRYR